jgi:hypothetical protein
VARGLLTAALLGIALAGCGAGATNRTPPPSPTLAIPSISPAIADTRRVVAQALAQDQFELDDIREPYRPPESVGVAAAPRGIFQVVMPDDPTHGYIVVYEFRDEASAAAAGRDLATYLGSGPGRVQFPSDVQHLIRQVGTTLVAYSWSPSAATDPHEDRIFADLSAIGTPIDVPR